MGPSAFNYADLSNESDEDIPLHLVESTLYSNRKKQPDNQKQWLWFLFAGVVVSISFSIFNTFLLVRGFSSSQDIWASADNFAGVPLLRPNQFFGLDKIDRNRSGFSTPRPFMNRVSLLTQVSINHPDYVYPDGQREWFSSIRGTISPLHKPFVVNKETSTIAQFRALDYGMERCQVTVRISSRDVLESEADPRARFNRTFTSFRDEPVNIAVYELITDQPLDVQSLSWKTKPERGQLLGTLLVGEGIDSELHIRECLQESLQTFEFACEEELEEACAAEWWQDERESLERGGQNGWVIAGNENDVEPSLQRF
ncbi:hypothetical protein CONPUDRAFT_146877 [Coniophora puteana RWD-64-598 SS2]|uniref:Ubiquitin 3 binding protein But2 C-terminal domain-containing protein n=1 Tax=Coniophora puteana (strain RWD-64-598) TaxID=741705 RepID=A0A5M3MBP7_CONPW|nr:uncharacterized protein CONPUDRAFT_146877 [Coniophora puteana RWD-64-598 SS2]EIW76477.1 hypothetical protein CONPUDRAFT_146877 [Coniophora puteana RWD-64-598 SS2]